MKHPVIFASDLHGNRYAYDKLFRLAVERGIKSVVLGGDLTPKWPVLSFMGRFIVPLDPKIFRPDENGSTYDAFLADVEPLVYKRKTEAEKHYVNLGGYVMHTGVYMEWKSLRAEQKLLRRMLEEFNPSDVGKGRLDDESSLFALDAEEWESLDRLISSLPSELISGKFWTLRDLFRGLRLATLPLSERNAALMVEESIKTALTSQVKGLSPAAQQCFRYAKPSYITPASTHEGDFVHSVTLCKTAAEYHPLHVWAEKRSDFRHQVKPQASFLEQWLNRRVKKFKEDLPGAKVFLILGNDDLIENAAVVKRMHERGLITLIDRQSAEIAPGYRIVGYPFVRDSHGKFYSGWEKSEEDIQAELDTLEDEAGDPLKTVFVVHAPPAFTSLDQSFGDQHFGSQGVREWLRRGPKHLVLSGHIHEAPFIGGQWRETVDGTPCIQPGAWHDEDVCAAVVDLDDPTDAEWIADRSKIRA